MWATDTTQKSKSWEFVLPDPDSPGIGLDSPDPAARSLRMSDPMRKVLLARSFRAYTRSFQVTLRPMASFGLRGINTPPYPFSHLSCQVYELNTHPSNRKLSHSPFYILEWFLWGIWVRVKQEQGFVLVSIILISWALGFGQAADFKFVILLALCS